MKGHLQIVFNLIQSAKEQELFSSETPFLIETKLRWNDVWQILFKNIYVLSDQS